jgi:adenine phosphoribosyltransferase
MDFPIPGIRFWNVNDLTATPGALTLVTDELVTHCRKLEEYYGRPIDYIGGFDARGFIFGATIAERLGIGFLQIRKKGKLPKPRISFSYTKEYSKPGAPPEVLEMNETDLSGKLVVLVDDLLATGGTAEAGCKLIEMQGGTVIAFLAITDLPALKGRIKLHQYHCHTLLTEIDGELHAGVRYCVDVGLFDEDTDDLLLINRLSSPKGLAMPGGGIEIGESPIIALLREVFEEAGCQIDPAKAAPVSVLVGADRDPRGDQVSIVYRAQVNTIGARGEVGKTQVERMKNSAATLPIAHAFAFSDHHSAVVAMLTA